MKASTIRALVWTATFATVGFCVWRFVDFVFLGGRNKATFVPSVESIRGQLRKVDVPVSKIRQEMKAYDVFWQVNLSGVRPKPPEKVESAPADSSPAAKINPLDRVVGLKLTRIDVAEPEKSVAIVYWKDEQISPADRKKLVALSPGTWFPKPYEKTYRLKRVEERRAIFEEVKRDGDTETFTELPPVVLTELTGVNPLTMTTAGKKVGVIVEKPASRPAPEGTPDETMQIRPHEYLISGKDRDLAKERGLDMIGRDVHLAPYLDPKTQRPEGLMVKSIRQDSLPARLGIRENDIVRGVNGARIRSTADIYAFAKDNPEVKDVKIEIEHLGRIVYYTYHLP